MLRFFYPVSCFLFILTLSCSRKINANEGSSDHQNKGRLNLSGSWELYARYGGNRAGYNSEIKPGNGDVYTFKTNHFEHYSNYHLLDSGRYELAKSRGTEGGDPLNAFVFNSSDTILFTLQKDTLILNPRAPMYDGIASMYVRVYLQ